MNDVRRLKLQSMASVTQGDFRAGSQTDDVDNPMEYFNVDENTQDKLRNWILCKLSMTATTWNMGVTSYGLKHLFEGDTGIYVTNGQFKGAMLEYGYRPKDAKEKNWHFRIRKLKVR